MAGEGIANLRPQPTTMRQLIENKRRPRRPSMHATPTTSSSDSKTCRHSNLSSLDWLNSAFIKQTASCKAFSSEVDAGSREENASDQNHRATLLTLSARKGSRIISSPPSEPC